MSCTKVAFIVAFILSYIACRHSRSSPHCGRKHSSAEKSSNARTSCCIAGRAGLLWLGSGVEIRSVLSGRKSNTAALFPDNLGRYWAGVSSDNTWRRSAYIHPFGETADSIVVATTSLRTSHFINVICSDLRRRVSFFPLLLALVCREDFLFVLLLNRCAA